MSTSPAVGVTIGGLRMSNPVMTASGTCGYGEELAQWIDLNRLGAIVTKTVTRLPREGNPPPRVCETASGMLNAIGLQNVGIEAFLGEKLPFLRQFTVPVVVNIAGKSIEEFADLAAMCEGVEGIGAMELNLSCPNVSRGLDYSTDPAKTEEAVGAARGNYSGTLIAKLSPNVTDIVPIALAAEESGADAISLINTLIGMAVDIRTCRPKIANITGGLSGPAIKPVALRMVYQVATSVSIPVIGIGGIRTADDALEFLMAGATAVQVGTASFVDPAATIQIIEGIEQWLTENGIGDVREIVGSLQTEPRL